MKKIILLTAIIGFVMSGCKKEEDNGSLSTKQLSLKSGTTGQISASSGCTFTSDNEYVATVSSSGLVNATRIGTANISVKKNGKSVGTCIVTVTARYSMYREPYFGFGDSKSSIKSYEKRTLFNENSTMLAYTGENSKIKLVLYALENSKYTSSGVLIQGTISNSELLGSFLAERYVATGVSDSDIFLVFTNKDRTVSGALGFQGIDILVMYFEPSSSSSINKSDETIVKEIQQAAKSQIDLFNAKLKTN